MEVLPKAVPGWRVLYLERHLNWIRVVNKWGDSVTATVNCRNPSLFAKQEVRRRSWKQRNMNPFCSQTVEKVALCVKNTHNRTMIAEKFRGDNGVHVTPCCGVYRSV